MEAYLSLAYSSFAEMVEFDHTDIYHTLSLIIAFIIFLSLIIFILIAYLYCRRGSTEEEGYFTELKEGLKDTRTGLVYVPYFLVSYPTFIYR